MTIRIFDTQTAEGQQELLASMKRLSAGSHFITAEQKARIRDNIPGLTDFMREKGLLPRDTLASAVNKRVPA